jgi:hypothetical protein
MDTPRNLKGPPGEEEEGGARGEVTRTESEPLGKPTWSKRALRDAYPLTLGMVPASPPAVALVDLLTARCVEAADASRKTQRRAKGMDKLRRAVGAIVGSVLTQWLHDPPEAVFQSHANDAFTGELVGRAPYGAAEGALLKLRFFDRASGVSYPRRDLVDGYQRNAARLRPTNELVALAAVAGVTSSSIRGDFRAEFPTKAARVPPSALVEVREVLSYERKRARLSPVRLGHIERLSAFTPIREEVAEVNAEATQHTFHGCRPPSWARIFSDSVLLNGRWQAKGASYQTTRKAQRSEIRIDGEAVVELDIRASHLTILAALAGAVLPDGDPYADDMVPRHIMKQWVMVTLGNGRPPRSWSTRTREDRPDVVDWPVRDVARAALARLPFLAHPTCTCVLKAAGLEGRVSEKNAPRVLSLRLMAIEAQAMTLAMRRLREVGVFVLPIHDSVIVQEASAMDAQRALVWACEETYGATPVVTGDVRARAMLGDF